MADETETLPGRRPFLEFRTLLRSVGLASEGRKLALAAVGLLIYGLGRLAIARAFGDSTVGFDGFGDGSAALDPGGPLADLARGLARRVGEPFRVVVGPFLGLFDRGGGGAGWSRSALTTIWAVLTWGVFGGAIARVAAVQATTGRKISIGTALRFAIGKAGSLAVAPLIPLVAVAFFAALCGLFGLIYRIPWGIGPAVASTLGLVPIFFGLIVALILVGLALGWPLMHATVAVEGEDAADAVSRSYSYVNQRLIRYLAHAALAWAVGAVGLAVATGFAALVLGLADWGVGLGAPADLPTTGYAGTARDFWPSVIAWVVHGWAYSFFWSAAVVVYLILRRDVDGTPWHAVYLPEHDADRFADDGQTAQHE